MPLILHVPNSGTTYKDLLTSFWVLGKVKAPLTSSCKSKHSDSIEGVRYSEV